MLGLQVKYDIRQVRFFSQKLRYTYATATAFALFE